MSEGKMKLTLEIAKEIARECLIKSGMKDGEWYYLHQKSVADVCNILGKRMKINIEKLLISAYLHDIGYSIKEENHAEHSLNILQEKGFEIDEVIKDCILNHGGNKNPSTKEGKVIQIADKISFLNLDVLKAVLDANPEGKIKQEDLNYLDNSLKRVIDYLKKIEE